jgi:hypothetical protein
MLPASFKPFFMLRTRATPLQDCLAALPCRTSFVTLVADYCISLKGHFNPPMWNNRELDLYTVRLRGRGSLCVVKQSCCEGLRVGE